jgi:hypothetical protein
MNYRDYLHLECDPDKGLEKEISEHRKMAYFFLELSKVILLFLVVVILAIVLPALAKSRLDHYKEAKLVLNQRKDSFMKYYKRTPYKVDKDILTLSGLSGRRSNELREAYEIGEEENRINSLGKDVGVFSDIYSFKLDDGTKSSLSIIIIPIASAVLAASIVTYRFHSQSVKDLVIKRAELKSGSDPRKAS